MRVIQSIPKNKKIVLFAGLVVALALTLAVGLPGRSAQPEYEAEPLARGDLAAIISANGTVRARQSANLVWETSGVVETVEAQAGEKVSAGQTLAVLAQDSLPQSVILAEANLVTAQRALDDLLGSANTERAHAAIALREAQEAYEEAVEYREALDHEVRYDLLNFIQRPNGKVKVRGFSHVRYMPSEEQKAEADEEVALRKAEMDDAQRAYERLGGGPNPQEVAAAEARILAAKAVLEQAKIVAPFDGYITESLVQTGNRVRAGQAAFQLHDLSALLVDLKVSEMDINRVALRQKVTLRFEAISDKEYRGEVIEIATVPSKDGSSDEAGGVNFRVTVEITDADGQVRPGMSAEAVIQVREVQEALLVPNRAIRLQDDGQRVVYLLREGGLLEAIPVQLGVISDEFSEVISGNVQAGDLVVLNPPAVK